MTEMFNSPEGRRLAYRYTPAQVGPTFVWLTGFKSDMSGNKVTLLEAWAKAAGHGFLAFDYSGHGQSGGAFEAGTISAWREDALSIIGAKTSGPLVLVGSSMGAWIALLAMKALGARVQAMVLLAPAPDFTRELMWPALPPEAKAEIMDKGQTLVPSEYDAPYPVTRALIDDANNWLVLGNPIGFDGPVRILQGGMDDDVPWHHAMRLVEVITSDDLTFTLIKSGDHRLSRDEDIPMLIATCAALVGAV
ncbi:MAG: alpha/beta hydrolase [Pseudomonadota bacterium]